MRKTQSKDLRLLFDMQNRHYFRIGDDTLGTRKMT
jgi:hypothetical protein